MRGGGSPAASELPTWSKKTMHERKLGARMAASMWMPSSSSSFRKSPAIVFFLGIFLLVAMVFRSNTKLADHNHNPHHYRHDDVVRVTTGLVRQAQHEYAKLSASSSVFKYPSIKSSSPSPSSSANNDSLSSLKELVKEAMDRGLVVIVNATEGDAARLFADNAHGARREWDINGALDGPTGEILAEVIQELRNMEELQRELAELKAKIKRSNVDDEGTGPCVKCRSGNKRMASSSLHHGEHKYRAFGQALHPLVIFSTFRWSLNEFASVGLAAPILLRREPDVEEDACVWVDWDDELSSSSSSQPPRFPLSSSSKKNPPVLYGQKRMIVVKDSDLPYDVVLIKCTFPDPAGSNGYGGHLYIRSEDEYISVLTEAPEAVNLIQFEGALKHEFAFCTPPIWDQLNPKYLKQWLMHHHHATRSNRVHYFFYHGVPTLDDATMEVLRPLLDRGMATLVNLSAEMELVGGPHRFSSPLLALNDCLQRSRFFADWAVFWNFNEYLQVYPPQTLTSLVHANRDKPYITFGSQVFSTVYCAPPVNASLDRAVEPWAADRMFLRLEHPVCGNTNRSSLCHGPEGERKWIGNPRKLYAGHVYFTIDPSRGGAEIPTETARLNKYIGGGYGGFTLQVQEDEVCTILKVPEYVDPSVPVDGYWFKDLSFSVFSKPAHALATTSALFHTGFREAAVAASNDGVVTASGSTVAAAAAAADAKDPTARSSISDR